jgi:hypothetical protein
MGAIDYRKFGYLTHAATHLLLPNQICKSAAGFYIGTVMPDTDPGARESVEYWTRRADAEQSLTARRWTQRHQLALALLRTPADFLVVRRSHFGLLKFLVNIRVLRCPKPRPKDCKSIHLMLFGQKHLVPALGHPFRSRKVAFPRAPGPQRLALGIDAQDYASDLNPIRAIVVRIKQTQIRCKMLPVVRRDRRGGGGALIDEMGLGWFRHRIGLPAAGLSNAIGFHSQQ